MATSPGAATPFRSASPTPLASTRISAPIAASGRSTVRTAAGSTSAKRSPAAPASLPVLHEAAWPVAGRMLHVAALAVRYDHDAWRSRFLADWPPDSPAHRSYFRRIEQGPAYSPRDAYR